MLRRTLKFLGGGGDHGMPTTKEAAHLVMNWVLSRPVPPPPGKGKCYARFTYPGKRSKFQLNSPERHEVRTVPLVGDREKYDVSSRIRLSDRAIGVVMSGWKASLLPSTPSSRSLEELETSSSATNTAKKVPRNVSSIRNLMQYDVSECNEYLHRRGGDLSHRLKDYNAKGYEREHFPWQPKPPSPPPKK